LTGDLREPRRNSARGEKNQEVGPLAAERGEGLKDQLSSGHNALESLKKIRRLKRNIFPNNDRKKVKAERGGKEEAEIRH